MKLKLRKSFILVSIFLLLSQFLFAGSQNIQLSKKWNLIGAQLDNIAVTQFDNSSAVSSVWTWDVQWQTWKGWSPNSAVVNLMKQYKMGIVSSISAGEGFWVNALTPWSLSLTGDNPSITNLSLSKKWNLLSVKQNITVDDLNKAEISSVWTWDVQWQTWKGWSPNAALVNLMKQYKMGIVSSISSGEGFWINASAPLEINFGESVKSGYYVYQYLEGSAPIPLSSVSIYKILDNGSFSDLGVITDSTGYAQVNVADNTSLAFVKDGFSTITYNHQQGQVVNIFMTQSSEKNLQLLMPPSPGVGTSSVKKSASDEGKSIQSPDSTSTVTFYNFKVKDEYKNYNAKLSYVPGKNLKLIKTKTSKYIPVGGIELTLATETGGALFEAFSTVSSDSTAYATGSIQLDEKLSAFLDQIVNDKKVSELKLFVFNPSSPLQGWQEVANDNVTLNAESNIITFAKIDRFAFYAVAFKKPAKLEKSVYFKAVDSDNSSVVLDGVNINILGQTVVTDESGLAKIDLILPAGGTVKVEAFYTDDYNPYKGFYKVSELKKTTESSPILLTLDKKNKENILTLKVEDSSDNSSIPFANLKIYTYTSLGNINHDGEYIYIGKEPGAEYSWFIKAHTTSSASTASIIVSSADGVKKITVSADKEQITGESLSKISIDTIVKFLKEKYEGDIIGDFDLISHVKHVNGYEEEGTIALLDLQFNGEEMLGDGSGITQTDTNNILSIDTNDWVFDFNNIETVNMWKGCLLDNGTAADNCTDFEYETLVKDDLIEFLSENAQFILSHANDSLKIKLQAYSCTEEGQDLDTCQSATVLIPLTTSGDILDVFTDVMPATDIPAIIETTTDAKGEFPFIVPVDANGKKLPDIVVNASKIGYKTAKGKKISTDNEEYTISLSKLKKIDYTITVVDSDTTDAIANAVVTLTEAVLDNKTGKLKDIKGLSDADGKVVFNGVLEGIHNLIAFKKAYTPFEGKVRVSERIKSKTVKLTANSSVSFDNLTEPFIEFENPVIINGELIIKGNIYDTDNDTYSGATKLQVKFNGVVDTLSINTDGSFQFRKALVEGRNSINLIAMNPKGKFSTGTMFFYYKAIEQDKVMISGNLVDTDNASTEFTPESYVYVVLGDDEIEFPIGKENSFSMILKGVSSGDTVLISAVAYDKAGNVYYGDKQVEVEGDKITGVKVEMKTETNDKLKEAYDEKHDDLQITKVQYSLTGATYFEVTGVDEVHTGKVLIKAFLDSYISGFTQISATIENSKGFLDVSDLVSDNSSEGSIGFPLNLAYGENFVTITVTNPPTVKHPEPFSDTFSFNIIYKQFTASVADKIPFTFKFVDKATGKAPEKEFTVFVEDPLTGEILDVLDFWKLKGYFKKCGGGFIEPKNTKKDAKFTLEIESKYYKDLKIFVDLANDKSIDNATVCGKNVRFKEIDLPLAGQFGVGAEEAVSLKELQDTGHVEIWADPDKLCKGSDGTLQIEGWFDIPVEHLKYKVFIKSEDNDTFPAEPLAEIIGKFNTSLVGGKELDNGTYDVKIEAYYLDNMSEAIGTDFTSFDVEDCGGAWQQPQQKPGSAQQGINPFHPPLIQLDVDNVTDIDGSFIPATGTIKVDNSSADCVDINVLSNTGGYYQFEITGEKAGFCSAKIKLFDADDNFLTMIPVDFLVKEAGGGSCEIKEATIKKTGDVTGTAGGVIGFKADVELPAGVTCPNCKYIWDLDSNGKVDGAIATSKVTAYFGAAKQGKATVLVFNENEQCIAKGTYEYNISGDALGGTPPQALDLVMYTSVSTVDVPECSCEGAGECSFTNLKACNNEFLCVKNGGFWDGTSCKSTVPCSVDNLEGCADKASCENNKGAWLPDGAGGGKCIYYDFIANEDVCNLVGGYWYNGECHKEAFSGQCSPSNLDDCVTPDACKKAEGLWIQLSFVKGTCLDPDEISQEDICEKAGGFWDNGKCSIEPPTSGCSPTSMEECYTKESCEKLAKGIWIINNFGNGKCTTLEEIDDKFICSKLGGYWYDDECHAEPNQCTPDNLTGCFTPYGCYVSGGYWYDNKCNETPGSGGSCEIEKATITKTGDIQGTAQGNIGIKVKIALPTGTACDNCTYVWDLDSNGKVDSIPLKVNTATLFYGTNNNGKFKGKATVLVMSGLKCIAKGEIDIDLEGDSLGGTPPQTLDLVVYTPKSQATMPLCCNNPVPSGCSADNLTACMNETVCDGVGGYWYDGECHAEPQGGDSDCSLNNLEACSNETLCNAINGYWYDDECHAEPQGSGGSCGELATATITKTGDITGTTGGTVGFKAVVTISTGACTNCKYYWDLNNDGKVDGEPLNISTVSAYYGSSDSGKFTGKATVYVKDADDNLIAKGEYEVDLAGDAIGASPPQALDLVYLTLNSDDDVPSCE